MLGLAILQALWIVTVPPFRASDEFDHAYRAAAVARGQWEATDPVEDGRGTLVRVPADLVKAAHAQCADLPYTGHDNCNPAERNDDGTVLVGSGAGTYNPIYYWVIGTIGAPVPRCRGSLRHASGLVAALPALHGVGRLGALNAQAKCRGRAWACCWPPHPCFSSRPRLPPPTGWRWPPGCALWCLLLKVPDVGDPRTERRMVILAVASACVLVSLRMLGPLFVLLIVLLAIVFHGRTVFSFVVRRRRLFVVAAGSVCLATAAAAAWTLRAGLVKGSGSRRATRLVTQQHRAVAHADHRGVPVPRPAWADVRLPLDRRGRLPVRLSGVAGRSRQPSVGAGSCAVRCLGPAVRPHLGVQGRSRRHVAGPLRPAARGRVRRHRGSDPGPLEPSSVPCPALVGAVALAACTAACLVKIVRAELAREVSATDSAWLSPPTWLLIAAALVAWLIMAVAISVPSHRSEQTT